MHFKLKPTAALILAALLAATSAAYAGTNEANPGAHNPDHYPTRITEPAPASIEKNDEIPSILNRDRFDFNLSIKNAEKRLRRKINHIAAICGDRVITSYDLMLEADIKTITELGYSEWLDQREAVPAKNLLQQLINQQLIIQEAEQFREADYLRLENKPFDVTADEINGELQSFVDKFPSREALIYFLADGGFVLDSIQKVFSRRLIVEKYLRQKLEKVIEIDQLKVMIEMARGKDFYKNIGEARQALIDAERDKEVKKLVENLRNRMTVRILLER